MRTRKELPGRLPIAPGQARLTLEFLRDGLPEKKLQLVGMSIILILLSLWAGVLQRGVVGERRRASDVVGPVPECSK